MDNILISMFNRKTHHEFLDSNRMILGTNKMSKLAHENSIVLLLDYESKEYFGIARIGKFDDGTYCRKNYLPNIHGPYTGDNSKYNEFEIPINTFHTWHMSCVKLINVLSIDPKINNNILNKSNCSGLCRAFYGNKNDSDSIRVLDNFQFIIDTVMERS